MRQHAPPKNLQMPRTLNEIPQKVPQRETLQHAAQSRILPHPLLPPLPRRNFLPFMIRVHDIQRHAADNDTLKEAHDVHIPIDARAFVQGIVFLRHEAAGQEGGEDGADPGVEGEGEEDFVDVEGESWEGEEVGEGFDEVYEGWWRG